jgi:hypothetical protein
VTLAATAGSPPHLGGPLETFTERPRQRQVLGFAGTVALWWCYFQRAEGLGARAAETADDAGAVGLWGTWTLAPIVLGLIGIAVGDELAIAHPGDDPTLGFTSTLTGGTPGRGQSRPVFSRARPARAERMLERVITKTRQV